MGTLTPAPSRADALRYAPPHEPAVRRGAEVAQAFGFGRRYDLTLPVNDVFSAQNRAAIPRVQSALAVLPGVSGVAGPAGLLSLEQDAAGHLTASPTLRTAAGIEDADEVVRQRLLRRSDALGWFVPRSGTGLRLLVDTDQPERVRRASEHAATPTGLVLTGGAAPVSAWWPDPGRAPGPLVPLGPSPWSILPAWPLLPLGVAGFVALLPLLVTALLARPTRERALFAAGAAGLAGMMPGLAAPVGALQRYGVAAGAIVAATFLVLAGLGRWLRARRAAPVLAPVRRRVPAVVFVAAVAAATAAFDTWPRVTMGTQLWRDTTTFLVSVRGDLEAPVVLREVRRLTEFLRAEPGVEDAWSIADLFAGVERGVDDVPAIPATPEAVRAILAAARGDAAVRLELSPDHRESLVGVRFDEGAGVDRLRVLEHLETYLARELRRNLLAVDVADRRLPAGVRAFGRGVLAADARERVLRICARAGRNLGEDERAAIERGLREAVLLPSVDRPRLTTDVSRELVAFFDEAVPDDRPDSRARAAERRRLSEVLARLPNDATVTEVSHAVGDAWTGHVPRAKLAAWTEDLARRLARARHRRIADGNFKRILYGADLPTEGVLSEEVRDATLEAMGSVAGTPVPAGTPGASSLDAVAIGGVAFDRALSSAWLPLLGRGVVVSLLLTTLLLVLLGGLRGLAWAPVAVTPVAPLVIVPALAGAPIGLLFVAVLAGALASGAAFAVVITPGRRDP